MSTTAQRTVLERFPPGRPRGAWPAEEYAAQQRAQDQDTCVVMDLRTDQSLSVTDSHPLTPPTQSAVPASRARRSVVIPFREQEPSMARITVGIEPARR
ncbi:hypothetical protein [Wenjunlia tyrosinilytica]|uniref:Uncharacterized protein n=1 Tax=Wenjunlia tyrosinilytica TaxID=1544741 RepID=A0A917ZXN4_9ACTN|nr:hypothetical protein [Wenjunlia tyrosinilytica]GGO98686.1 hypothetical protein GCM10012280_63400 [Wenjunlia tyrosinilytica]